MNEQRIVSLLPGCSEVVCALGLRDRLVGRSHECDFPPDVRLLPVCTAPKLNPDAPSRAIDRSVKSLLRDALSVFEVDTATLRDLRADLVLTQTQCEACAVTLADVESALNTWAGPKPDILSLAPGSLVDVWSDIRRIAAVCGVANRGEALVGALRARVEAIAARGRAVAQKPAVACIEWLDPLMAAGNWVPEVVALAGGRNLFGEPGRHSPWLDWEQLRRQDPDVMVVMPCGFDLARTRREMPALTQRPDWDLLGAVRNRRVYLVDGNQYFNRPGPRLVDSLEILAEMLHPEIFPTAGKADRWEPL